MMMSHPRFVRTSMGRIPTRVLTVMLGVNVLLVFRSHSVMILSIIAVVCGATVV